MEQTTYVLSEEEPYIVQTLPLEGAISTLREEIRRDQKLFLEALETLKRTQSEGHIPIDLLTDTEERKVSIDQRSQKLAEMEEQLRAQAQQTIEQAHAAHKQANAAKAKDLHPDLYQSAQDMLTQAEKVVQDIPGDAYRAATEAAQRFAEVGKRAKQSRLDLLLSFDVVGETEQ